MSKQQIDRRSEFYNYTSFIRSQQNFDSNLKLKDLYGQSIIPLYTDGSAQFILFYYNLFSTHPEFFHDPTFVTPEQNYVKGQFEEMVAFAKYSVTPRVTFINNLVPKPAQKTFFYGWFNILKPHFLNKTGRKNKRSWWEQNLNFDSLFPMEYYWSKAPRLSARGSTLNSRKKILKRLSCISICQVDPNLIFIDIDIQSAHNHFAAKIAGDESVIQSLVTDKNIWKNKIKDVRSDFVPFNIDDKIIKRFLKIGVYGTLNGGNPVGNAILDTNIMDEFFSERNPEVQLQIRNQIKTTFETWNLIEELKSLNSKVTQKLDLTNLIYSIDRIEPYMVDQPHKAISRYLQGYEVILLSVLSYFVLYTGGLVINLEHDGLLCLFTKKPNIKNTQVVDDVLSKLSIYFNNWSKCLLNKEIKIEPKIYITSEGVYEYE